MTPMRATVLTGLVAVVLGALPGAAASASPPEPGGFGHHVVHCAQVAGFDGMHNPGMHQGFSGWSPDHQCAH